MSSQKNNGLRKGYSKDISPKLLDKAAAINSEYVKYADKEYLSDTIKSLMDSGKAVLGDLLSKRVDTKYAQKLADFRRDNYESIWYESGWFENFNQTGFKIVLGSRTFWTDDETPYNTNTQQAYCLDRVITADFSQNAGIPYGFPDVYPDDLQSGQKCRICGYKSTISEGIPFISPYRNVYHIPLHSGKQIGSIGRNYFTQEQLVSFGISESQASGLVRGVKAGINISGRRIPYNKVYLQDNIPNLDWCLTNKCKFIYTNIYGLRNSNLDDPYAIKPKSEIKYRVFVFSGDVGWIPTGESSKSFDLGYGPYFQAGNTGLYRLYNDNFNLNTSGTRFDRETYGFSVFNTGDTPVNFYLSSNSSTFQIIDDKFKLSNFYHPDNTALSGQQVKYYTVGKNSSIRINYQNNYTPTAATGFRALPNGTKIYTKAGSINLHQVTGTILINDKLNFLTKDFSITGDLDIIQNNMKVELDDVYFSTLQGGNLIGVASASTSKTNAIYTDIDYDFDGRLIARYFGAHVGQLNPLDFPRINSSIIGLSIYAKGANLEKERASLKARSLSGQRAFPSYQSQVNATTVVNSSDKVLETLNTERQYLRYREGFSGLFLSNNPSTPTQTITTNLQSVEPEFANFNPITGALQLDLLFKVQTDKLPTYTTLDKEEYAVVGFSPNVNRYSFINSNKAGYPLENINSLVLKRGYKYNLLQTGFAVNSPLAVRGDISGLKIFSPNYNNTVKDGLSTGNYRLIQFTVDKDAKKVDFFSASSYAPLGATGTFSLSGNNIGPAQFNIGIPLPINSADASITGGRPGVTQLYRINRLTAPEMVLESDQTYQLFVPIGNSGFYFYTGPSTAGGTPYVNPSVIQRLDLSGVLLDPITSAITGFTRVLSTRYTINAAEIPNNLYYGNTLLPHAGNRVVKTPPTTVKNKFVNAHLSNLVPISTGSYRVTTSDKIINREFRIKQNSTEMPLSINTRA